MSLEEKTKTLLYTCDLNYNAKEFLINVAIFGILFGLGISLLFFNGSTSMFFLIFFCSLIVFELVIFGALFTTSNKRISMIEDCLPDFLTLMSSNIRSGLTPDRALILSARKEFGPLTKEIDRAAKATLTGTPFTEAFMEMARRVPSETLSKTIRLIVEGVHSGGNLAELLEATALDIRRFEAIKKEVSATVLIYKLFVFAAVAFGAPLLYAVSNFLIGMVADMKSKTGVSSEELSAYVPLMKGSAVISPELVFYFSIAALFVTAVFGALTAGVVSKGKESEGFSSIPFLLFIAFAIFFLGKLFLEISLKGMFMV